MILIRVEDQSTSASSSIFGNENKVSIISELFGQFRESVAGKTVSIGCYLCDSRIRRERILATQN